MKYGLSEKVMKSILHVLETNTRVDKAYLFGSRAKGNFREGSDIDLALKGKDLNYKDIQTIGMTLDDLNLAYTIDLLNYDKINEPDLINHIDRVGIEFYTRNKP